MPKTVKAELIVRYPSGKETKLGDVEIETHARYSFSFDRVPQDHSTPPTVTDSYRRIEKEE
jgi:hypothetical protein